VDRGEGSCARAKARRLRVRQHHQTFPLHGYPSDFFRFSKEALALIFKDAGLHVAEVGYEHRAKITAPNEFIPLSYQDEWNASFPSYMVVNLLAAKRG
jgi:hypothetical protein